MKTCQHVLEGGRNQPTVLCARPAKHLVKDISNQQGTTDLLVCGTHANFWKARGMKLIEIKP